MAIYRNVHISFWNDAKVSDEMTPEDKYFMLYLLTNPLTSQVGCYAITKRQMSYETGYNVETIDKLLLRLEKNLNVIKYDSNTKEVLINNWYKYNWTASPKILSYIKKELKNIKSKEFIKIINKNVAYIYGIDTLGIQKEQEQEQEQKKEQEKEKKQEQFNIFWSKYPKKVSKEQAKKAFFKTSFSDEMFSEMLNSLEKFKKTKDWLKDKGQYIPYPATWLNQKRWEDEFENNIFEEKVFNNIDPEVEARFNSKAGEIYGK